MFKIFLFIFSLILLFSCKEKEPNTVLSSTSKKSIISNSDIDQNNPDSILSINFITGLFEPKLDSSFTMISENYADRHGMYMKKEAYKAFVKMWDAAKQENINLVIRSAARNFEYQKGIWERKWNGETILSNGENAAIVYSNNDERAKKILEYSSMPGTSRHHWGTDIDMNSFENEWFESGEGLKLFSWLEINASKFGFCRPYTQKGENRPYGYNEEKWHWSYTPLSEKYTAFAEQALKNSDINGFKGSQSATNVDVVKKYILGINHNCK